MLFNWGEAVAVCSAGQYRAPDSGVIEPALHMKDFVELELRRTWPSAPRGSPPVSVGARCQYSAEHDFCSFGIALQRRLLRLLDLCAGDPMNRRRLM
jgi:hypothetical protein